MRRIYLKRKDLSEAKTLFFNSINFDIKTETIQTVASLNRITSTKVLAKKYVPDFTSAAMDGVMVRFEDTIGASFENPKILSNFDWVNTGQPISYPYNAVIMIEDILEQKNGILIRRSYSPWENVRLIGEDFSINDLVLPSNHKILPEDILTLLDSGNFEVEVYKKLKVALLPTGDELVDDPNLLSTGKVFESNSHLYKNYLEMWGCNVDVFPITKDNADKLEEKLIEISTIYDVIITIAGSSAGSKDFTANVLEKIGRLFVHGINLKPGKPLILGEIKGKPFVGLPGYPTAGYTDFMIFVKGLVEHFYNINKPPKTLDCRVGKKIYSNYSVDEYIRVVVGNVSGSYVLSPLKRGSAPTKPLVESDGYIIIPKGKEGLNEGEITKVFLNEKYEINKNIIFIGSNDLLIDIIKDHLKKYGYTIKISNQGSMSAISAISKKLSHFGGLHLLNPENGEYNIHYVEKFLSHDYVLINLSYRKQGIVIPKNNPKNISKLEDLTKVVFVNRQIGSGTRALLDYLLEINSIDKNKINGYENIEFTHSGVCTRVANGNADCGIAIYPVAKLFNLDFIPIGNERYDLLVDKTFYNSEAFSIIKEFIKTSIFVEQAKKLGGYDLRDCGKLILSK